MEIVRTQLPTGEHVVRARPQVGDLGATSDPVGRHLRRQERPNGRRAAFRAGHPPDADAASWVGLAETLVFAATYGLMPPVESLASATRALREAARLQGEQDGLYVEGLIAFGERRWSDALRVMTRATEVMPGSVEAPAGSPCADGHGLDDAAAAARCRRARSRPANDVESPCSYRAAVLIAGTGLSTMQTAPS